MSGVLGIKVRGGQRERGLERGPRARATQPSAPGGRPLSPDWPVPLRGRELDRRFADSPSPRSRVKVSARADLPDVNRRLELTDRAIALIALTLLALVVCSVVVIVTSFFAVSDAPVDGPASAPALGVVSR